MGKAGAYFAALDNTDFVGLHPGSWLGNKSGRWGGAARNIAPHSVDTFECRPAVVCAKIMQVSLRALSTETTGKRLPMRTQRRRCRGLIRSLQEGKSTSIDKSDPGNSAELS